MKHKRILLQGLAFILLMVLVAGCGVFQIDVDMSDVTEPTGTEMATRVSTSGPSSPTPEPSPTATLSIVLPPWQEDKVGIKEGQVVRLTNAEGYYSLPAWSPDGRWIAFIHEDIFVLNTECLLLETVFADMADACRGGTIQLTSNMGYIDSAAWSPDGNQIAFSSDKEGDLDIYLMDVTCLKVRSDQCSIQPERILDDPTDEYALSWTPDGRRLLFRSKRFDTIWEILYFEPATGAIGGWTYSQDRYDLLQAAVSPDGSLTAMIALSSQSLKLAVVGDDYRYLRIASEAGINDGRPVWHPDGDLISFDRYYRGSNNGSPDIHLIDPQCIGINAETDWIADIAKSYRGFCEPIAITREISEIDGASSSTWSPDGKLIAFSGLHNGNWDLYVMRVDQKWMSEARSVAPAGLVYQKDSALWMTDFDGVPRLLLDDVSGIWHGAQISPDGTTLIYRGHSDHELWLFDLATMDSRNLTRTSNRNEECPVLWPGDSGKVFFGYRPIVDFSSPIIPKWEEICGVPAVINLDGTDYHALAGEEINIRFSPAPSPDGKIVVLSNNSQAWLYDMDAGLKAFSQASFGLSMDMFLSSSWAPQGEKLAWIMRDKKGEIYEENLVILDFETNRAKVVYSYETGDCDPRNYPPAWSPSGEWIALYMRCPISDELPQLMVIRQDGSSTINLGNGEDPVWSPDSRWLVFSQPEEVDREGNETIWLFDMDNRHLQALPRIYDAQLVGWVEVSE